MSFRLSDIGFDAPLWLQNLLTDVKNNFDTLGGYLTIVEQNASKKLVFNTDGSVIPTLTGQSGVIIHHDSSDWTYLILTNADSTGIGTGIQLAALTGQESILSGGNLSSSSVGTATPMRFYNNGVKWLDVDTANLLSLVTSIKSYNGVSTVAEGIPYQVATANATAQSADIGATTLLAVPASGAGFYRFYAYAVVTRAGTVSSTLPSVVLTWTDRDASTVETYTATSTSASNAVGQVAFSFDVSVSVKASTNIQYSTTGYASAGATSMQFAVRFRLERMGA